MNIKSRISKLENAKSIPLQSARDREVERLIEQKANSDDPHKAALARAVLESKRRQRGLYDQN